MLLYHTGRQGLDKVHKRLKLLQIKQRSQTHGPEDRQYITGHELDICETTNLCQDFQSCHHHGRFFSFDTPNKGYDLFLHSKLVQSTSRHLLIIITTHDAIKAIITAVCFWRTTTKHDKCLEAPNFDAEAARFAEDSGNDGEELVFYSAEIKDGQHNRKRPKGRIYY